MQPWHTPFPIWNQSVIPCPVLTVASWPAYRFLRRQVRWSGIPISFRIFSVCGDPHKGFGIVNKAEVDFFWNSLTLLMIVTQVKNFICPFSAQTIEPLVFSIMQEMLPIWTLVPLPFPSSLNIWKFTINVPLKPGLENFEHYFVSMWDECNCVVVWAFFGIWTFSVLWLLLSFSNLLACWVQHFNSIFF